jgi:hypothetical protein
VESPNHISNTQRTCSGCNMTKRGPLWKRHCDKLSCGWGAYPVEDVIELGVVVEGRKTR